MARKNRKLKVCKARPAVRTCTKFSGLPEFDSVTPIPAEPIHCMIVQRISKSTNVQIIHLPRSNDERHAYMAAENRIGARTMREY